MATRRQVTPRTRGTFFVDAVTSGRSRARGLLVRRVCLAIAFCLIAAGPALAQEPQREFWPEVDIWWRVSPAWRLSVFVPLSRNIDTDYREGSLSLRADYAFGTTPLGRPWMDDAHAQATKRFLVRGGYLVGKSLGDQGAAYSEHAILAEFHVRSPLKGNILLSQRLRADLRWLGNEPADFSNRWRYRLRAEREFQAGRTSITPFFSAEPYYDSRYDTVNRVRLIPGAALAWSPRLALEGNVTFQYDSKASNQHLQALNLILHLHFGKA
jgi:hypothetical protein